MSDEAGDALTLANGQYGKIGVVHCGVSKAGQVTAAGDVMSLEDGETHTFGRAGITVRRAEDEYHFARSS